MKTSVQEQNMTNTATFPLFSAHTLDARYSDKHRRSHENATA